MDDLEVDLDDTPPRVADAPAPGPSGRRLRLPLVLSGAAVAVVAGLLLVPRTLPDEPAPRVTVDYLSPASQEVGERVDLHEDAQGRPVGPATLTVGVQVTAVDVPPGVRGIEVGGPTGPSLGSSGPADGGSLVITGPATGLRQSGTLTFTVACDDLPDAPVATSFGLPVSYDRPAGRRTTTATGSLAGELPSLLGRVCTARTLRGDVSVVGVDALPDRSGLRITVENRGRRTVWLRSVLDGGSARDAAGPGTSVHVVRLGGTACALMSVLLGGRGVSSDGTVERGGDGAGSLRIGVMGSLTRDAVGPAGAVMPVGLSAAAEQDADAAMKSLCGT